MRCWLKANIFQPAGGLYPADLSTSLREVKRYSGRIFVPFYDSFLRLFCGTSLAVGYLGG